MEAPLQKLHDPLLEERGITLWIKREDLLHPHISGNKWRKLKYNLQAA
ncbi:MAG: 1-aminocyclopropane-1-carboxylate deaminase/D-cysteine desulfhydrase, partial [Pontibacter sp.]|nr:1-aminocyclopropane-1-carboxylate deaminase/D-cysteine desulfhydrase [Pontibacter sp.]